MPFRAIRFVFRLLAHYATEYCDQRVCLSLCTHISETTRPNFTKFSVHVVCGLWRRFQKLRTSGFVDEYEVILTWGLWWREATAAASLQCRARPNTCLLYTSDAADE